MEFTEPYSISRTIAGRFRRIDVLPGLLKLWWATDSGPQAPGALVEANSALIDDVLMMKLEEGSIDPLSDDPIKLQETDLV